MTSRPDEAACRDIEFGLAGPTDLACLQVLATQVYLDTYATAGIRPAIVRELAERLSATALAAEFHAPDARVIVARRGECLVGFAQVALRTGHVLVPAPAAELGRLYVQSHFLRRGIGTALLARAEELASAAGRRVLWLEAYVRNERALAFYAARGYRDRGRTDYVFEDERFENRLYARPLDPDFTCP